MIPWVTMKSHTFITKWSVLFSLNFYPWKNIRILSQTRPLFMFIVRVVIILWVRITFSRSSSHVMEIVPKKPWRKEATLSGPCTWEFSSGPSSKGLCGQGLVPSETYGEVVERLKGWTYWKVFRIIGGGALEWLVVPRLFVLSFARQLWSEDFPLPCDLTMMQCHRCKASEPTHQRLKH